MNEGGEGLPDLSTMLSKVMENPQAISMLSSLLKNSGIQNEPPAKREAQDAPHPPPAEIPCKGRNENRRRLLLALKPYLSAERCRMIDRILMITDALGMLEKKGGDR